MARTYEQLNVYPKGPSCAGCPLYNIGASFARTLGSGRNGVGLLGEALGESEALAGKPFQGDAGYQLKAILHRGGFKQDDFLIFNTTNCHPPKNYLEGAPYEQAAIAHCDPYFEETLQRNPQLKVLVPMGNIALAKLLGHKGIKNFHGTVHRWRHYYVVPTLHPSYILRNGGSEFPTGLFDITRALEVCQRGWHPTPVEYILRPTPEEFLHYVQGYEAALAADPDLLLASDIETAYSSSVDEEDLLEKDSSYVIERISFSFRSNTAITVPFNASFMDGILRLLGTSGFVCFWNGNKFDVPRLRHADVQFKGIPLDGMDAWHVLRPDLPKGLGYVSPFFTDLSAWKHLSDSEPEYYSCQDSDALLRIMLKIRARMRSEGIWDTFLRHWTHIEPRLEAMSTIGIGVDEGVRSERQHYYEDIRDNTAAKIQAVVPFELKPDVKKGGYKGKPKDVRELTKTGVPDEEAWLRLGYYRPLGGLWNKKEDFNHNSPLQILNYIRSKYDESDVPRDKKTGKPTTGLEELDRLARSKGDEVLSLIVDAAQADSNITSFIKPWTPGPDGRIHGTFTNVPSTHRLASQNPNLQNFPRRSAEALAMRRMIVPGDGWEFLCEADWRSIEAILVGWYAKSPTYMRIAYMGIHDFMAGVKLGMKLDTSMSDGDLKIALKEAKKLGNSTLVPGSGLSVREACKVSVHGGNYHEGALLLHNTYPELFPKVRDAQEYQDFYFGLFQDIPVWQQKVVDDAYDKCYTENAWKLKRWFWNIKKWQFFKRQNEWKLVDGDDAKKAISTNPQGSAGIMMRFALGSDAVQALLEQECLMLSVHDSLVARARDKRHREWVIEKLIQAMEFPVKEMDNIVIPVEIKSGRNWGTMGEISK